MAGGSYWVTSTVTASFAYHQARGRSAASALAPANHAESAPWLVNRQPGPQVAALRDGSVLVAWEDKERSSTPATPERYRGLTRKVTVAQCTSQSAPEALAAGTIWIVRTFQRPLRDTTIVAIPELSVMGDTSEDAALRATVVSASDALDGTDPA